MDFLPWSVAKMIGCGHATRRTRRRPGVASSYDTTGRTLRHHERTGHPLGDENFLTNLEGLLNRMLKPRKPEKQENLGMVSPEYRL